VDRFVRELPQKITLGQAYDQAEMTVEAREELKGFALASLQSGRVCVAPFEGDKQ